MFSKKISSLTWGQYYKTFYKNNELRNKLECLLLQVRGKQTAGEGSVQFTSLLVQLVL